MILIVEDEASIRKLAAVNLLARGYTVTAVESAEEGLALLREQSPALLLLDIKLPGMQGWDLLKAMADDPGISPDTPVIVMTAAADVGASARDYPNVVKVLIKPFNVDDLLQAVKDALS